MLGNFDLFGLSIDLDWQGECLQRRMNESKIGSMNRYGSMAEWLKTKRLLRRDSCCMTSMVERLMEPASEGNLLKLVIQYDCARVDQEIAESLSESDDVLLIQLGPELRQGYPLLPHIEKKRMFIEIIRSGALSACDVLGDISTSILRACDEVDRLGYANEWVWANDTSPSGLRADMRIVQDADSLRVYVDVYDEREQLMLTRLIARDDPDVFPTRHFNGIDWVGDEEVRALISTIDYKWDSCTSWISIPIA